MRSNVAVASNYSRPHNKGPKEVQYRPWNAKAIMEARKAKLKDSPQEIIQSTEINTPELIKSSSVSSDSWVPNISWEEPETPGSTPPNIPTNISEGSTYSLANQDHVSTTSSKTYNNAHQDYVSDEFNIQTCSWPSDTRPVSPIKNIGPLLDLSTDTVSNEQGGYIILGINFDSLSTSYLSRPGISSFIKDLVLLDIDDLTYSTDECGSQEFSKYDAFSSKSFTCPSVHSAQDSMTGNDMSTGNSTTNIVFGHTAFEKNQDYMGISFQQQSNSSDPAAPRSPSLIGRQTYSRDELMSLNTYSENIKGIEAGNLIDTFIKDGATYYHHSPSYGNRRRSDSREYLQDQKDKIPFMRIIRPVINPPDNVTKGFAPGRCLPQQIGSIPLFENL
ncbi:hypothetical protein PHYBLDRAFT_59063 [Phycomyces blakesleeanus NRRL 1555(-)]|uniref:Uncharacterized protein n=1 Tax=Phycomyces blakesleeanus (strain ATCC 8743b / DSM 1359 / FGSC 10004 / NBRC 33097 / NRRL 1555) TaxID=763407 RepID=A0A167QPJ7_PHYB8|nr:hypothetical protein PHYBLDRAFT_59063 [Phycomyces blakesleeanus NRRL 1555(-)]OAD80020.1 hypothetical protein PHYBLDRAFT_59063 [Phycomyces blakesleeanus NRRL 1555(-)]|eukprot:XP_018298060.1 hypothetical protein PHYBLDRAFT_59063 [Phycomyces blakesleeanus NRRL 1555(-)]